MAGSASVQSLMVELSRLGDSAGIISLRVNYIRTAGCDDPACEVSIPLVGKVLDRNGSGGTDGILDGMLWAVRQGANVVSMSLGLDFPGMVARLVGRGIEPEPAASMALAAYRENVRLFDAVAALVRAHAGLFSRCMIVAAAGNESRRPRYEIATAPPAAADGILSVGALRRAAGAAPSYEVASSNALPDVAAPGVDVRSAGVGGGLVSMNGTSMATPHVAGVAALWLEKLQKVKPDCRISELEARLVASASAEGIPAGPELGDAGAGLVQAPRS
jgi:subtilisin family serine protease